MEKIRCHPNEKLQASDTYRVHRLQLFCGLIPILLRIVVAALGYHCVGLPCCAKHCCRLSLCDAFFCYPLRFFCYPLPIPPSLDISSIVRFWWTYVHHSWDNHRQSPSRVGMLAKVAGGYLRAPAGSEKFRLYDYQSALLPLPIFVPSRFATQQLSPKPISKSIVATVFSKIPN